VNYRFSETEYAQLLSNRGEAKPSAWRKDLPIATEHEEQASLITWARGQLFRFPELDLLFAIPNGSKLPYTKDANGKRRSREAMKLLREGLRPGCPDLMLPVARGGYYGCFIEMKRQKKSSTSDVQNEMIARLQAQGYLVAICKGWEVARDLLVKYLES